LEGPDPSQVSEHFILEARDELKPNGKELEDFKRTKDLESRDDIIAVALKLIGDGENPDSLAVVHCCYLLFSKW